MIVFCCPGNTAQAQQAQSIHIQSEGGQPFGVTLNDISYTSSRVGYLVIPNAAPGRYNILVSVPDDPREYRFSISVEDRPVGFSLKQGIDNGWTLFDMVDYTFIRGSALQRMPPDVTAEPPSLPSTSAAPTSPKERKIQKIFDKSSAAGIDQVYVVINGNKTDTVALFIPILESPQQARTGSKSIDNQSVDILPRSVPPAIASGDISAPVPQPLTSSPNNNPRPQTPDHKQPSHALLPRAGL